MKKISILIAVTVLFIYSLACQTVMGTPNTNIPIDDGGLDNSTLPPVDSGGNTPAGGESDYPLPDDAFNVTNMGNNVVNFQTDLSLEQGMTFYRDQFGQLGYTERDLLTVTSDTTFSMVFDGHEGGKPITVQALTWETVRSISPSLCLIFNV